MDTINTKDLIKSWYRSKALNEQEPFFKFLCLWICLNAWLSHQSQEISDRRMINWLKSQDKSTCDILVGYEAMRETTQGSGAIKILVQYSPIADSSGRREAIEIKNLDDRDNIIEAIYRIRCNLFHGGKSSTNTKDRELVQCANVILTKWVGHIVAHFDN